MGNPDFLTWASDGWVPDYEGQEQPYTAYEFDYTWLRDGAEYNAPPLTTLAEVENAIRILYEFRRLEGLEQEITFPVADYYWDDGDRGLYGIPDDTFEMCSVNTQRLGLIYLQFYYKFVGDTRSLNWYPLLNNIIDWMMEQEEETSSEDSAEAVEEASTSDLTIVG